MRIIVDFIIIFILIEEIVEVCNCIDRIVLRVNTPGVDWINSFKVFIGDYITFRC